MLVWVMRKMFGVAVGKLSEEDKDKLSNRFNKLVGAVVVAAAKEAARGRM